MAASVENFRSALHGFNRTDVVQFIQQQTIEHEKTLRRLREENTRLLDEFEAVRAERDAQLESIEALQTALDEAVAEKEALTEGLSLAQNAPQAAVTAQAAAALDAPMMPAATVAAAAPNDFNELELAAYRRAELTERMAKERAAASSERMRSIFSQADEKLCLTAQDFATLLDTFRNDFEQLQQAVQAAQSVLNESSAGLKFAAELCDEV